MADPNRWLERLVSAKKQADWDRIKIGQCLALSLSYLERNEPLLIAASHFWSDALNVFLFRNGPMTITRADVVMITGLNITESISTFRMFDQTSHKLHLKEHGGWTGYVSRHQNIKLCWKTNMSKFWFELWPSPQWLSSK